MSYMETIQRIKEILKYLQKTEHDECEDCFYSCPLHEDYCGIGDECNCGMDENNMKISEALALLKSLT